MRLVRLDLIRYGHFTDVTLEFQPGFNLVLGANEAGKSTTLRALRQLLFGFDHRCPDAFLHPTGSLRIGAVIEDHAGTRIECIRRKSQRDSLRGPDDVASLPDDLLERILDGVDQAAFQQRFGIDYEQLLAGGREICAGRGDLGEILFAAASGIADLARVQKELADQAAELFSPRGSKPVINKQVSRLNELRRAIREQQLPTAEWERHEQILSDASAKLARVQEELEQRKAEQRRLGRLEAALPLVAKRRALVARAEALRDIPLLPDDFGERRRELLTTRQVSERSRDELQRSLETSRDQLHELDVPSNLLHSGDQIRETIAQFGSYRKARQDRVDLVAQLETKESEIRRALAQLGRSSSAGDEPKLPTRQVQARIEGLARERQKLLSKRESAETQHASAQRKCRDLKQKLAELPRSEGIDQLRSVLLSVRPRSDSEARLDDIRCEFAATERHVASELARLGLGSLTVEQFRELRLPALATIDRFAEIEKQLGDQQRLRDSQRDEAQQSVEAARAQIDQLRLAQDVPTLDDLKLARQLRDEGWQWVQRSWRLTNKDDAALRDFLERAQAGQTVESAFEQLVERADQIADRLRREADNVARHAQATAELDRASRRLDQINKQQQELDEQRAQFERDWRSQWDGVPVTVLSPGEMRWLREAAEQLIKSIQQLDLLREKLTRSTDEIQQMREALLSALDLENDKTSLPLPLAALCERAEQELLQRERTEVLRAQWTEELKTLEDEQRELADECAEAASELVRWQDSWAACMAEMEMDAESSPEEAGVVIETTREILAMHREADTLRRRIRGIDGETEQFEQDLQALLTLLAPDLLQSSAEVAVRELDNRLDHARQLDARRAEIEKKIRQEEKRLDTIEQQLRRAQSELEVLCRDAGTSDLEQLPQLEQQSRERRQVLRELDELDQQLLHLAGGRAVDEFVADAEQQESEALAARLEQLGHEIPPLEEEYGELRELVGRERAELARMDGRAAAAELEDEAAATVAAIRNQVEEFARLRLAGAILRETVERYRSKHQAPVLCRASELFAELTLGAFRELRVESSDQGRPVLVGVRANGAVVHVEAMSTGTSDQLYLALRVASLEHYFSERPCVPFIIDDILVMFDDARAAAALRVLAELGQKTQVIFFTHHEHLAQLAERTLAADALTILALEPHPSESALPRT